MGNILRTYLLNHFLKVVFISVISLAMLFMVFDLLANTDDILAGGMPAWQAVPLYAFLRLPQIVSLILPIAAMLAIMAVYGKLQGQHEVTAMTSAGIRLARVVWVFVFGALIVTALHFIFLNSVVTEASERLRMWQKNDFKPAAEHVSVTRYPAWFQVEDRLLYVEEATRNNEVLKGLKVIERGDGGVMERYTLAGKAEHIKDTEWQLTNVEIRKLDTGETEKAADRTIDLKSKPDDLAIFNKSIEEMTLQEMTALMRASHLTNNRGYYYETWFMRRFSQPLSTVIMMLIATPLLFMRPRQRNKMPLFFGVVLVGFLFFIGERILLAMGESGDLPPQLTIWAPPAVFTVVLLFYVFWKESRLSKR